MQHQTSFFGQFFSFWGWSALGAAAIGLTLAVSAYFVERMGARLASEGVDAVATVTDKDRDTSGEGTDYEVTYQFPAAGRLIEDRQDVSLGFYNRLAVGDQIPVRYWAQNPSVSEVELGATASTGKLLRYFAIAFGLAALVLGRLAWKRADDALWLMRHGARQTVSVAGHHETSVAIDDHKLWKATWIEPDGRAGATRMMRRERLPEIGSSITVLIDPEHRRASLWENDL